MAGAGAEAGATQGGANAGAVEVEAGEENKLWREFSRGFLMPLGWDPSALYRVKSAADPRHAELPPAAMLAIRKDGGREGGPPANGVDRGWSPDGGFVNGAAGSTAKLLSVAGVDAVTVEESEGVLGADERALQQVLV